MSGLQPTKRGWSNKEQGPSSSQVDSHASDSCVTMFSQSLQPCGRLI